MTHSPDGEQPTNQNSFRPTTAPLGRPLDIAQLLTRDPPALDEVLPGLPAGTVGMLAGPGGVGKTMLELQLAVSLAAGAARCDGLLSAWGGDRLSDAPARVVLVAAEEPAEVIWLRLRSVVRFLALSDDLYDALTPDELNRRLCANLCIHALGGEARLQLIDERLQPTRHASALLQASEGARLVLLDPLRQLHLADENSSQAMSALVSVFKRLASQSGAALVYAHHTSRAAQQLGLEQADAARGSTALTADARWQLNLSPLRRDAASAHGVSATLAQQHALLHLAKSNYAPHRAPLLLQRQAQGVLRAVVPPTGSGRPTRGRSRT